MQPFGVIIFLLLPLVRCAPVTNNDVMAYLQKYGYLEPPRMMSAGDGKPVDAQTMKISAIKKLQRLNGLEVTGLLNEATKNVIAAPRCGLEDVHEIGGREMKFNKMDLTFSIDHFWNRTVNNGMTESNTRNAIHKAFAAYSSITPLTFTEVSAGEGDIRLMFGERRHNDFKPFDGRGGELAHAAYPQDGSVHFDADEKWTIMSPSNLPDDTYHDFLTTAIHELGHSLGIRHRDVSKNSMMWSKYKQPRDANGGYVAPNLDEEVIKLMHRKYGAATAPTTSTGTGGGTKEKDIHACTNHVYAALSYPEHGIMIFPDKGTKLTVFNAHTRKASQYVDVSEIFSSGPTRVTAAYYSWHKTMFMLFHGNQVWGYDYNRESGDVMLATGYPKKLPIGDDWNTGAAVFADPRSVLVSFNKTAAYYNEHKNTMEIVGHVSRVYPNIDKHFAGIAMISHGVFAGFTESTVFKYDFEGKVEPLGRISDFVTC